MKNIIFIIIAIVIAYLGFSSSASKTITFGGDEYKLASEEGNSDFNKLYYTKSGEATGRYDYIEILKFKKSEISAERLAGARKLISDNYRAKNIRGISGQFGIFGPDNDKYAYLISPETDTNYWFMNFIIQSGSIDVSEAKKNTGPIINDLKALFSEFE